MKPPVKKVVVYVVDFARNAIKMGRNAALGQILRITCGAHPPAPAGQQARPRAQWLPGHLG